MGFGMAESEEPTHNDAWGQGSLPDAMGRILEQPCGGGSGVVQELPAASVNPGQFVSHFYHPGRPLLMRGAASSWPMREAWTRQRLLVRQLESNCARASAGIELRSCISCNRTGLSFVSWNRTVLVPSTGIELHDVALHPTCLLRRISILSQQSDPSRISLLIRQSDPSS